MSQTHPKYELISGIVVIIALLVLATCTIVLIIQALRG